MYATVLREKKLLEAELVKEEARTRTVSVFVRYGYMPDAGGEELG